MLGNYQIAVFADFFDEAVVGFRPIIKSRFNPALYFGNLAVSEIAS